MTGLQRITDTFTNLRRQRRAALMPYFTLGFPGRETSLAIARAIATAGADLIELGLPFSDPLADGPSIQHSTQLALQNGLSTAGCMEMVERLRQSGVGQPLMLMSYYNPILSFGIETFAQEACAAGADGLIVPDLPVDEADVLESVCARLGLALVFLVAPTTTAERLARVTRHSTGFVYIVSLTGVTGAREAVSMGLEAFLARVREVTDRPLAVGFGISTPAQAAQVGQVADGVIVGSALLDAVAKATDPVGTAGDFVRSLSQALAEKKREAS